MPLRGILASLVKCSVHSHSQATSNVVSTWMGDHLGVDVSLKYQYHTLEASLALWLSDNVVDQGMVTSLPTCVAAHQLSRVHCEDSLLDG